MLFAPGMGPRRAGDLVAAARRSRGRGAALAVATAALAHGGASEAQSAEPIVLAWSAPPECPGQAEVRAEIDRLLGGAPRAGGKQVRASATIARTTAPGDADGQFHMHLETKSGDAAGARDLDAAACPELGRAAALIVALAFDPDAVSAAAAIAPAATPGPGLAPTTSGSPPATAPPSAHDAGRSPLERPDVTTTRLTSATGRPDARLAPPPASLDGAVELAVTTDAGALPAPGFGVSGAAAIGFGRLRVALGATVWARQHRRVSGDADKGGDFDFALGWLSPCFRVLRAAVELDACVALEVGRMHAQGFGVVRPHQASTTWVAPGASLGFGVPLDDRVALRADAGARFPLSRPQWTLIAVGPVDQPGPVTARASVGAEVRF